MAAHLLRRVGFGASWEQVQQVFSEGPQAAADRLLRPPPDYGQFEERVAPILSGDAVSWLYRILETPWPVAEKMTLFWHHHFAVGASRAGASLTASFIELLRSHALGRFDQLLTAACRHPALYAALDARAGRKANPRRGFASSLLGLYTVGPGMYSDADVRDTARAFTGAFVLREQFCWLDYEHDRGPKSILGRQGDFGPEDVLRVLLEHPATPRWIVRKLYGWLVSELDTPDDALLAPLAGAFARDYDIGKLVGTILRSSHFYSPAVVRRRVKSPVEFAAGIAAALEISPAAAPLHQRLAAIGQNLFEPPTREGWAGGRYWLNGFTRVGRANLAAALLGQANPRAVAERHGEADPQRFFADFLLESRTPAPVFDILCSEEFQLA
jgi:uncharacterized protein (DUF1800 family)